VNGGFSSRRLGFIRVRFVVTEVTLRRVFSRVSSIFLHLSTFHLCYITRGVLQSRQLVTIYSVSKSVVLSPTQNLSDYWERKLVRFLNYVAGDSDAVLWDRMQSPGRLLRLPLQSPFLPHAPADTAVCTVPSHKTTNSRSIGQSVSRSICLSVSLPVLGVEPSFWFMTRLL
jgi:hypothetical protein